MSKKLILVTGATGNQGGSVINALLAHGGYSIRAQTRDVNSDAAKALAAQGIEVVPGQLSDRESMIQACKGVYAVFGVSVPNFGKPGTGDELVQGQNLVDACKANDVPLLIWSSLPSCKDTSGGKWTNMAFDSKAEVEKYIKQVDQPAVVFRTGGFTENMLKMGLLKRDEHDPAKWHIITTFGSPGVVLPSTYVSKDLGPTVVAAIDHWEDEAWKAELTKVPIPLVSYKTTGAQMAEVVATVTGKEVDHACLPVDKLPPPFRELAAWTDAELWGYGDTFPVDLLVKLGVKFHTLEDYVRESVVPWMKSQN